MVEADGERFSEDGVFLRKAVLQMGQHCAQTVTLTPATIQLYSPLRPMPLYVSISSLYPIPSSTRSDCYPSLLTHYS